ncbi:DNA invertase Pin-like site-specific DNA recombinase [Laceyella sacchari]|jgi:DNA invertase Pin-like site-specific DNA recombinase|uniref:Site-specific DNA recombinase n=2 Tax=Laceyella TaxID=292635 RepID=A0AA46AFV7_9BACL|nr:MULTISPECIES: recombinase family protein [Laceyella]PRZ12670.1 DNA invertase Pin-like site-specific DNA recombinase [Laceyella sediminis]TCW39000.1 DNA invertase Pin-like site-specific DNA recombinase [Laceyella sacchari]SMP22423.1 Site-specific DNA recombinase [Laceyella tengchongensis]
MIYGYARVSTKDQSLDVQVEQLRAYGVDDVVMEKVSGRSVDHRTGFKSLLGRVKKGDTIVVTKLDRFARSTKDALETIEYLNDKGVGLVILNFGGMNVDTTTPTGKLMITMFSAVAEFELGIIKERQREGIAKAKERGVYKGRPKRYTANHAGLAHALELYQNRDTNGLTVKKIAEITNISEATIYREARKLRKGCL